MTIYKQFYVLTFALVFGIACNWSFAGPTEVVTTPQLAITVSDVSGNDYGVTSAISRQFVDANSRAYDINVSLLGSESRILTASIEQSNLTTILSPYFDQLQSEADAVSKSGIEVSAAVVIPDGYFVRRVGDVDVVTSRIVTARQMNSLPVWEESLFVESQIYASTGRIVKVEVHDQTWYDQHPGDYAQDNSLILVDTASSYQHDSDIQLQIVDVAMTGPEKAIAVAYANKWWNSRNLYYDDLGNSDCTNFISQALYAGGWSRVGLSGAPDNRADSAKWWYDASEPFYRHSHSWTDAQNWKEFAYNHSGRVTAIAVSNADAGDVIQYDIGLDGMNHTTIVTYYDHQTNQPFLTYHSNNTHNIPLAAFRDRVAAEANGKSYHLYGWRT